MLLALQRQIVKWAGPTLGTGAVVRYAFVRQPTERPGAINCREIEPVDAALTRGPLRQADFERELRFAMAAWQAAADVRFEPAEDPATADLLIGAQRRPRGIAFADVIPSPGVAGDVAPIARAAICFNPLLDWEVGFDGDKATPDVRYVAAHELGHVLGLDHAAGDALMNHKYRERHRVPQPADLAGAVRLYGPRPVATVAFAGD